MIDGEVKWMCENIVIDVSPWTFDSDTIVLVECVLFRYVLQFVTKHFQNTHTHTYICVCKACVCKAFDCLIE